MRRKIHSKQFREKCASSRVKSPNASICRLKTGLGKSPLTIAIKLKGNMIHLEEKSSSERNTASSLAKPKRTKTHKPKTELQSSTKSIVKELQINAVHLNRNKDTTKDVVYSPSKKDKGFDIMPQKRNADSNKRVFGNTLCKSRKVNATICQPMQKTNTVHQPAESYIVKNKNITKSKATKTSALKPMEDLKMITTVRLKTNSEINPKTRQLRSELQNKRNADFLLAKNDPSADQTHKTSLKQQKTCALTHNNAEIKDKHLTNVVKHKERTKIQVVANDKTNSRVNKRKGNFGMNQENPRFQVAETITPNTNRAIQRKKLKKVSSAKAKTNIHSSQNQESAATNNKKKYLGKQKKPNEKSRRKTIIRNKVQPVSVPIVKIKDNVLGVKAVSAPTTKKTESGKAEESYKKVTPSAQKKLIDERKAVSLPITKLRQTVRAKQTHPQSAPALKLKVRAVADKPKAASDPVSKIKRKDVTKYLNKKKISDSIEHPKPSIRLKPKITTHAEGKVNQNQIQSRKTFFQQFTADQKKSHKRVTFKETDVEKCRVRSQVPKSFEERVQDIVRAILRG